MCTELVAEPEDAPPRLQTESSFDSESLFQLERSLPTTPIRTYRPGHIECRLRGANFTEKPEETAAHLKRHIRTMHPKLQIHTCDTCHRTFSRKHGLERHLRYYCNSKPPTCDKCHRTFTTNSHLKTHIKYRHGQEETREGQLPSRIITLKYRRNQEETTREEHLQTHLITLKHRCGRKKIRTEPPTIGIR